MFDWRPCVRACACLMCALVPNIDASSSWPFKTPSNGCRQQITAGNKACSSLQSFRCPCLNHLKTCPFIAWYVKDRSTITVEPLSSTWENQSYSGMELALIGASFWRNPGNIAKSRCATLVRPEWPGTVATGASLWGTEWKFLRFFLLAQDKTWREVLNPSQLLCVPWSISFQPLFQHGVENIIANYYLQTTKRAAAFTPIKSSFSQTSTHRSHPIIPTDLWTETRWQKRMRC